MNIENKQTALDDDAEIYQHPESETTAKSEREKLSDLPFKGKLRYLWDYYALPTGIVLVAIAIIVAILVHFLSPKPDRIADIAVIDSPWYVDVVAGYSDVLLDHLGLDKEANEILISDGYRSGVSSDAMAIATHMYGNDIDIMIGSEKAIRGYAENGAFIPLDTLPKELLDIIPEEGRISTDKYQDEGLRDYAFCVKGTAFEKYVKVDKPDKSDESDESDKSDVSDKSDNSKDVPMFVAVCRTSRPERQETIQAILRFMIEGK